MAVSGTRPTIATTATIVYTAPANSGKGEMKPVRIQNPVGGQVVYLGGTGVTTALYGYALAVGGEVLVNLDAGETLYGIVAATTQQVNVLSNGA